APVTRGQQPPPTPSGARYVPDEVLVRFRPTASNARRNALLGSMNARLLRSIDAFGVHRLRVPRNTDIEALVAAFRSHPDFAVVQPNYIMHAVQQLPPPNDPRWLDGTLYGLVKIQAQAGWTTFTHGDGSVVIADIDTGINYNHPDLQANVWSAPTKMT